MPNSIELIKKYGAENLDRIFVQESVTGILENRVGVELRPVENDAKTVYIPDIAMDGLGDYDMENGFPKGAVTLKWTPYQCNMDRGKEFSVDAVQNAESAGVTGANLMTEFERTRVIPEVDAYRLSKLYANALPGNIVSKSIADNTILKEFNSIIKFYNDNEIPLERVVFFISTDIDLRIKNSTELTKKITQADYKVGDLTFKLKSYENIPLVVTPPKRFKTTYTFNDNGFAPTVATYELTSDAEIVAGKTYYTKAGEVYTAVAEPQIANIGTYYEQLTPQALDMSILAVHTNAALPYKKHQKIRVFEPDVYQGKDAWVFQHRLYHDIITPINKQKGIYVITAPAV